MAQSTTTPPVVEAADEDPASPSELTLDQLLVEEDLIASYPPHGAAA